MPISWRARGLACGLGLALFAAAPVAAQTAPKSDCDRLAQPPRQALGKLPAFAEGVSVDSMRPGPAREACSKAMAEFPDEVRFVAYAARAASRAGDKREAVRLYRIAVEKGSALAQNNLAAMYAVGEGALPRNEREAVRLYKLAADQGFASAQSNLGTMYSLGQGVRRDDREAVRLFMLAAENEDSQAQNNLGKMYAEGRGGLPRDNKEAARMWRLAAEQGSVEAAGNLRKMGVR